MGYERECRCARNDHELSAHTQLELPFPLRFQATCVPVCGEDMLNLAEVLAARSGQALTTPAERRQCGKHIWRSAGAAFVSRAGLDFAKI